MTRQIVAPVLLVAAVAGCFREPPRSTSAAADVPPGSVPPARVKVVVLVVFDQMKASYLEDWKPLFGPNGFNRLMNDGAWFANCNYPYATTTTGPGHASILTGCSADRHGIINNNWYDRQERREVYCAGMARYQPVTGGDARFGAPAGRGKPGDAGCPDRMLAKSVGDVLKEFTKGQGKVVGLSIKDRSAIFPTGHNPDGAYWFGGAFLSSNRYRDSLPSWLVEFNRSRLADTYYGKDWVKFRPDLDYEKHAQPDDGPGEGTGIKQGRVFPHPTTGGLPFVEAPFYAAMEISPFGNDLLLAATKAAVAGERLGSDEVPDLLTVSFSSNDLIGHTWGPDSQEMLDVTLRSDALMADFLKHLDESVGRDNYLLLLTADHGVCPNPEVSVKLGRDAKRVPLLPMIAAADAHLQQTYPELAGDLKAGTLPAWLEAVSLPHFYLNEKLLKEKKLDLDRVTETLAANLRSQDGLFRAYTRRQLLAVTPPGDRTEAMARKSYHPDRGGNVVVYGREYDLFNTGPRDYTTGTTHGSPHSYDTHVPLLAYGPGIAGGRRDEAVTPQHAAAIAARWLGVPPPRQAEYPVPATLEKP